MAEVTEQIQTVSNIPEWARKYAAQLFGRTFGDPETGLGGLLDQPYRAYEGQRVAGLNPLELAAMGDLAAMGISPQIAQATGLAGLAGLDAQRLSRYTPIEGQNFYEAPDMGSIDLDYQQVSAPGETSYQMAGPERVGAERVSAGGLRAAQTGYQPDLQAYQMGPVRDVTGMQFTAPQMAGFERVAAPSAYDIERAQAYQYGPLAMTPAERVRAETLREYRMGPAAQVGTERFGLGAMQAYMSPYMQGVVERQKQAAVRDYARQLPGLSAAATRVGARGGTREALLEAEARRGLSEQLGNIEATGLQQAYEQSAAQFERDRAAQMQAQLANQAAIQDVARQNLQAAMGIQQLGTGQSLQAQLANQQAGLTVGQQNLAAEQARQQFMGQQSLQAQLANQQAAQRAAEFQRQQQMQASLANQQAGLTVGQQNLAAQLQTMGLNAQQAIEAARLNQAADLTVGQQNLASQLQTQQLGTQTGLQTALANLNAEQQARVQQQANELQAQGMNQDAAMRAALANQQTGVQVGQQNLQAQINQAQFAAQQAMQAGQLNKAAQLQQQAQALQQQQALNQLGMQGAGLQAQYGLAGAQMGEQSRQFGANLGLQGLQQQLASAGMLGQLGQQQYQQGLGISQAQLGAGSIARGIEQQNLANQYQDFINQQQYPYKQLEFASGILRGFQPTGQTSTLYQAPGSTLGQVVGAGVGLGSLFGAFGGGTGG